MSFLKQAINNFAFNFLGKPRYKPGILTNITGKPGREYELARKMIETTKNDNGISLIISPVHVFNRLEFPVVDTYLSLPASVERAIFICLEILKYRAVDLLVIDSLFAFVAPNEAKRIEFFKKTILAIKRAAHDSNTTIAFINPNGIEGKFLTEFLLAHCSETKNGS